MVDKACGCGLQFDGSYLAHYVPCFNSELNDSLTAKDRLLGQYVQVIGARAGGNEQIHRSVIDRINLASLGYDPGNVPPDLRGGQNVPIVGTSRPACRARQERPSTPR